MKRQMVIATFAVASLAWSSPRAADPGAFAPLARSAVQGDATGSAAAVAALRSAGPAGLDALLATWSEVLDRGPEDSRWKAVARAVDGVAAQRDAWASRVYWYTDLDQAKAAAKVEGKPILSLRLLGRLDEDLSCANSRFFRTALYPNAAVSKVLRERFVLHWQSVRPAPRITVDMGDGRIIERTITGNSLHYMLDSNGRFVDVIPGLYGPEAFARAIVEAGVMAKALGELEEPWFETQLRRYHNDKQRENSMKLRAELARLGIDGGQALTEVSEIQSPDAIQAGIETRSKMRVERPLLQSTLTVRGLEPQMADDAQVWVQLAASHRDEARLDPPSLALMRHKLGEIDDDAFRRMVNGFEQTMAEDALRNEYRVRVTIRSWIAAGPVGDLASLTQRIYAQAFRAPDDDPWLGLVPADAYAALDDNGLGMARPPSP